MLDIYKQQCIFIFYSSVPVPAIFVIDIVYPLISYYRDMRQKDKCKNYSHACSVFLRL